MHPGFTVSRTSVSLRGKAIPGAEDRQRKIPGFDQELFSKCHVLCVGAEPLSMVDSIFMEEAKPELLEEIGQPFEMPREESGDSTSLRRLYQRQMLRIQSESLRGAPIFETLGVRLMCLTAALDNIRSQKGIDAAGFRRMGEREVVRPDGTTRASVYWEMTKDEWVRRYVTPL